VCAFFCERNPDECLGRSIVQYPIACSVADWRVCQDFSFNPNVFSESTWAQCCIRSQATLR